MVAADTWCQVRALWSGSLFRSLRIRHDWAGSWRMRIKGDASGELLRSGTSHKVEDLLQDLPCVLASQFFLEEHGRYDNEGEHKEGHTGDPNTERNPGMLGVASVESRNGRECLVDYERAPHSSYPAVPPSRV